MRGLLFCSRTGRGEGVNETTDTDGSYFGHTLSLILQKYLHPVARPIFLGTAIYVLGVFKMMTQKNKCKNNPELVNHLACHAVLDNVSY